MDMDRSRNFHLTILLFSIMVVIGFIGNLRGVLLPSMKQDLGISYTSMGLLIFITSLGYFVSTLIGGIIGDKIGQKNVIALGFFLIFLGITGIASTRSYIFLYGTMMVLNLGIGCFDIGINSLAPRVFIANTAVMMSIMHVFFGLGSSLSPKLASWMLLNDISWHKVYLFSLILVGAVLIIFLSSPSAGGSTTRSSANIPLSSLLKDKRVLLFIGVLGFCESTEMGISNWLINFLQVERGMNESSSAQYMFNFFIIYTAGRIFGGYIAEKLGYIKTVLTFVAAAMMLFLTALFLGGAWSILFSLTGFFISIMFPTMVTIIAKEFRHGTSSVLGVVFTAAGLISMTSNWVIGRINDSMGVFAGFGVIPVYALLVIALLIILRRYLSFDREEVHDKAACSSSC